MGSLLLSLHPHSHSRLEIAPAVVLYFITQLVSGYESGDTKAREMVDRMAWYFLPVLNPDGYDHSFYRDRMWRKNRRPETCPNWHRKAGLRNRWLRCCDLGVDLNRNFDWFHCGKGASDNPCSEIYCGPEAFSEPETEAVAQYVERLTQSRNLLAFLTLHSYSQFWMYPYGHEKHRYARNKRELQLVAHKAIRALKRVSGTQYELGTSADKLYEAAGGSDDWAHGKAGVRFVYLVELRPCEDCAEGFLLPPAQIRASGEETWAAVAAVARHILRRYASPRWRNAFR